MQQFEYNGFIGYALLRTSSNLDVIQTQLKKEIIDFVKEYEVEYKSAPAWWNKSIEETYTDIDVISKFNPRTQVERVAWTLVAHESGSDLLWDPDQILYQMNQDKKIPVIYKGSCKACIPASLDLTPNIYSKLGNKNEENSCLVWVGMTQNDDGSWYIDYFKANFRFYREFKEEFQFVASKLKGVGAPMLCACISLILKHGRETGATLNTPIGLTAVPLDDTERAMTQIKLDKKSEEELQAKSAKYKISTDKLATFLTTKRLTSMYKKLGFGVLTMDVSSTRMEGTLGSVKKACAVNAYFGRLRGSGPAARTRHYMKKPAAKPS